MSELIVENVSFAYGKENIIEDIRLELHDHELVSLLGASGGGKTTLFHVISGFQSRRREEFFWMVRILQDSRAM